MWSFRLFRLVKCVHPEMTHQKMRFSVLFSWPWQKRKPEFKAADSYKTFELFFLVDILSKSAVEFHLGKLLWCTATNNPRQRGSAGYHEKTHSTCILSNVKLHARLGLERYPLPKRSKPIQFLPIPFLLEIIPHSYDLQVHHHHTEGLECWKFRGSWRLDVLGELASPRRWRIPVRCQSWTRRCIVWKRRG